MMKYRAGQKVGKGTYWNISDGTRVDIADEGTLPGDSTAAYTKFSPGVMLVAGPVVGLFYVIAMPFMAVGTILVMAGGKILSGLADLIGNLVSFGWRPSEAHLAGKKKGKRGKKKEHAKDN
jgi:hypothetical protein